MMKKILAVAAMLACFVLQAGAAEQLTAAAVEQKIAQMTELDKVDKTAEIVRQFGNVDLETWRAAFGKADKAADEKIGNAYNIRGRARMQGREADTVKALKDLSRAVELNSNPYWWNSLGDAYASNKDQDRALECYMKAVEGMFTIDDGAGITNWMPLSAACNACEILMTQCKYDEALKVLAKWKDEDISRMGKYWGARFLRERGHVYAGLGEEELCLKSFRAALEFEAQK